MKIAMKLQLTLSAAQVRMARAGLKLTFAALATRADVSTNTLVRLESGEPVRNRTVAAIRIAFEAEGVEFIDEDGGVGVLLKPTNR